MLVCTPVSADSYFSSGNRKPLTDEYYPFFAPQAQLLETAKSVGPEALFKQVVIFRQFDPLWSILGDS